MGSWTQILHLDAITHFRNSEGFSVAFETRQRDRLPLVLTEPPRTQTPPKGFRRAVPTGFKTSAPARVPGFDQRTTLKTSLPTSPPLQESYRALASATRRPRGPAAATPSSPPLQEASCPWPHGTAPSQRPLTSEPWQTTRANPHLQRLR